MSSLADRLRSWAGWLQALRAPTELAATAEKGALIFEHIVRKIRSKVILDPPPDDA